MIKKTLAVFCGVALLFAFLLPASADVVWEPESEEDVTVWKPDNAFYTAHEEDCGREYGDYQAKKVIPVLDSPENGTEIDRLAPGQDFSIYCMWGEHWALLNDGSGWVELDNCALYYSKDTFYRENEDQFVNYEFGKREKITLDESLLLWDYPGNSAKHVADLMKNDPYVYYDFILDQPVIADLECTWIDPDGNKWAKLFGYYNYVWTCLNDPENMSFEHRTFEDPSYTGTPYQPLPTEPTEPTESTSRRETEEAKALKGAILPTALVCLVMLVTGVLIFVLSRKNRLRAASDETAAAAPAAAETPSSVEAPPPETAASPEDAPR